MKYTLENGIELTLPDLHIGIAGPPNSGKTHFAASAETPMIVLATDPKSKMEAYYDRGLLDPQKYTGQFGQQVQLVKSLKTGKPIIQIEYYYDIDYKNPTAYTAFDCRVEKLTDEVNAGMWRTVVVDSWSQLEWIARMRRSYGALKAESSYLGAMDDMQSIMTARLTHLECNLIVVFHIETKVVKDRQGKIIKDARIDTGGGVMSYSVQAIGKLKNIANILGEMYLAVAPTDGSDNYHLETRQTEDFTILCSRKGVPNPCPNKWNELFGPWIQKEAEKLNAANGAAPTAGEPKEEVKS